MTPPLDISSLDRLRDDELLLDDLAARRPIDDPDPLAQLLGAWTDDLDVGLEPSPEVGVGAGSSRVGPSRVGSGAGARAVGARRPGALRSGTIVQVSRVGVAVGLAASLVGGATVAAAASGRFSEFMRGSSLAAGPGALDLTRPRTTGAATPDDPTVAATLAAAQQAVDRGDLAAASELLREAAAALAERPGADPAVSERLHDLSGSVATGTRSGADLGELARGAGVDGAGVDQGSRARWRGGSTSGAGAGSIGGVGSAGRVGGTGASSGTGGTSGASGTASKSAATSTKTVPGSSASSGAAGTAAGAGASASRPGQPGTGAAGSGALAPGGAPTGFASTGGGGRFGATSPNPTQPRPTDQAVTLPTDSSARFMVGSPGTDQLVLQQAPATVIGAPGTADSGPLVTPPAQSPSEAASAHRSVDASPRPQTPAPRTLSTQAPSRSTAPAAAPPAAAAKAATSSTAAATKATSVTAAKTTATKTTAAKTTAKTTTAASTATAVKAGRASTNPATKATSSIKATTKATTSTNAAPAASTTASR